MEKRDRSVSVISPSGSCPQLNQLIRELEKLNYPARVVSQPAANLSDLHSDGRQILFLSQSDQMAGLLTKLRSTPVSPRLAILAKGMEWDREVLSFCTEVIAWPCGRAELAFRLEGAFNVDAGQTDLLVSELSARTHMLGQAPSFLEALSVMRCIAKYDATVLITGETGTGKELAASAIHYLGDSRDGPFVPVNCGGIPDELFENELFGHTTGAYTDAKGKQCGYVEHAAGGTLFLDEIDALSLKSQTTLLRFLQDQMYKPLGSETPRHANVRIIAATNVDLHGLVKAQQFRQDLLFRLDVLSVSLPPLRDRPGDAALLAGHFVRKFSRDYGKVARPLHPDFLHWINSHPWPGNIRELENTILRAFLLSDGMFVSQSIESDTPAPNELAFGQFGEQKAQAIAEFERGYLERLLDYAQGNISLAARLAGKERRALGKLLKKHGINRLDFVPGDRQ